jgi:hypothetical protein
MWHLIAGFLLFTTAASAQILQDDNSMQEQLLADSFKITASATASNSMNMWRTSIAYGITNNSGMNLYLGISQGGFALGSCTDLDSATSGLPLLPAPNSRVYSSPAGGGEPRGIFVPSGVRVAGTIVLSNCAAPNLGSATAPLSLTLMMGKKPNFSSMFTFPLSADVPIRQLRAE